MVGGWIVVGIRVRLSLEIPCHRGLSRIDVADRHAQGRVLLVRTDLNRGRIQSHLRTDNGIHRHHQRRGIKRTNSIVGRHFVSQVDGNMISRDILQIGTIHRVLRSGSGTARTRHTRKGFLCRRIPCVSNIRQSGIS